MAGPQTARGVEKPAKSGKIPRKGGKKNGQPSSATGSGAGTAKSESNRSGGGPAAAAGFVALKKSKKAKSKRKKSQLSDEKNSKADGKRKAGNEFENLGEEEEEEQQKEQKEKAAAEDDDRLDSEDELVEISSASDSSGEEDADTLHEKGSGDPDRYISLVDSDSEDAGAGEEKDEGEEDQLPPLKRQKVKGSNMDDDYIAFDFSSDEGEAAAAAPGQADYSAYDDNEYLSNDEGSYHSKNIHHKAGEANDEFPWIRNSDHSREREMSDWLTSEIKDFVRYISPSAEEINNRNKVINNLKEHIRSIWPDAELHCFGSFATDLYLPGSDIDCVVISKRGRYDNKSSLYQLTSYIRNHNLGVEVVPIAKAKVPIIKFVDPQTRIHIDISFEKTNGLTAAKLIIDWLAQTPGLRELVLIVKHFLAVRKLNEVHVGGLGGFSIICLVYSFLKLHPRLSTNNIDPMENLGCLLIEFFELYGYNFGYDSVALAFNSNKEPIYLTKRSNPDLLGRNPFSLAIQDPYDPANNISRGSFNLKDIKRAFGGAFELLVNKCYELNAATYKQRLGKSILGGIIKYKGKQRDFLDARKHVKNVAFHAASGKVTKKTLTSTGGLPPLPSEKAGIDVDDYFMSDSYYSESESDTEKPAPKKSKKGGAADQYSKIFESSQKTQTVKKVIDKKPEELLDIKDDTDDAYTPELPVAAKKEPDFTDSDSDYDPSSTVPRNSDASVSAYRAAKEERREYWTQKSGGTF